MFAGIKQLVTEIKSNMPRGEHDQVVVLVEENERMAQDLAVQLGHFGYCTSIASRLDQLPSMITQLSPVALVMDIVLPGGKLTDIDTISALQGDQDNPCPVIFASQRSDMIARLHAVRAGGYSYFSKPIEIASLIDTLDRLTARQLPDPYRVLIVDDSRLQARTNAAILERVGMRTAVVTEPLQMLLRLNDFQPDLILMDMYMPDCNGQELAAVVRQQPAFVSVPIVFLSAEKDRAIQLSVMHEGVDDFLTKPISPRHLVAVVQWRAQRARLLRDQMIRDGLTGLLNHTASEAQLEMELARAQRHQTSLAVAMIDVDHFKSVNDTYGHAAGDRVLKSLARLLQQRLRRSDIIGRYGGEEFSVVLPDTDGATAQALLDHLRSSFAQIRHQLNAKEWYVTFSCGIACATTEIDAKRLATAADMALYAAKRNGRNQVVLFDEVVEVN